DIEVRLELPAARGDTDVRALLDLRIDVVWLALEIQQVFGYRLRCVAVERLQFAGAGPEAAATEQVRCLRLASSHGSPAGSADCRAADDFSAKFAFAGRTPAELRRTRPLVLIGRG